MSEYKDFSSLPPETEREFVVFEKTSVEAGKKAKIISLSVAFGFLALVLAIVFSFPAPHNLMAEDDMGGLSGPKAEAKDEKKPAAEKPKAEGEAAADKPAEGAAAGGTEAKPAEGAAAGGAEAKPAEGAEAAKTEGSK